MNDQPVKVSVAFITYNHETFIRQALDSVLMQKTDFPFEIVIGEDCSTDKTREIIQSYQTKYPEKIKLVTSSSNVGPMPNVVRTYKACKGKYIAILEGDDYWIDPLKLQKQVDLLEAHPEFSMCFTDRSVVDEKGELLKESSVPEKHKRDLEAQNIIGGFTPPTQTVVFKRSYLSDDILKGLIKVFNGDTFLFSLLSVKTKVSYIDQVTAAYRINKQGHYTNKDYINRMKSRLTTYKVLERHIDKSYWPSLHKAEAVTLQRLYILYLQNKLWCNFYHHAVKIILFDIKHFKITFLKANKLLLKIKLNKDLIITD